MRGRDMIGQQFLLKKLSVGNVISMSSVYMTWQIQKPLVVSWVGIVLMPLLFQRWPVKAQYKKKGRELLACRIEDAAKQANGVQTTSSSTVVQQLIIITRRHLQTDHLQINQVQKDPYVRQMHTQTGRDAAKEYWQCSRLHVFIGKISLQK